MMMKEKVVRPGGLELPTFWFVVLGSEIPSSFFGVAYEPRTPFRPSSVVRRLSAIPRSENRGFGWSACVGTFGHIRQRVCNRVCNRSASQTRAKFLILQVQLVLL